MLSTISLRRQNKILLSPLHSTAISSSGKKFILLFNLSKISRRTLESSRQFALTKIMISWYRLASTKHSKFLMSRTPIWEQSSSSTSRLMNANLFHKKNSIGNWLQSVNKKLEELWSLTQITKRKTHKFKTTRKSFQTYSSQTTKKQTKTKMKMIQPRILSKHWIFISILSKPFAWTGTMMFAFQSMKEGLWKFGILTLLIFRLVWSIHAKSKLNFWNCYQPTQCQWA